MAETTLDEVRDRKEAQAREIRGAYTTYLAQETYRMWEVVDKHTPFTPTNMDSPELQLVDAELSQLFGDAWCHQQLPNALWNQFYLNNMHYTVGEWLQARDSDWQEGAPWLKVSLAQYKIPDGTANPYVFLLDDEEVQILMAAPDAVLRRVNL